MVKRPYLLKCYNPIPMAWLCTSFVTCLMCCFCSMEVRAPFVFCKIMQNTHFPAQMQHFICHPISIELCLIYTRVRRLTSLHFPFIYPASNNVYLGYVYLGVLWQDDKKALTWNVIYCMNGKMLCLYKTKHNGSWLLSSTEKITTIKCQLFTQREGQITV